MCLLTQKTKSVDWHLANVSIVCSSDRSRSISSFFFLLRVGLSVPETEHVILVLLVLEGSGSCRINPAWGPHLSEGPMRLWCGINPSCGLHLVIITVNAESGTVLNDVKHVGCYDRQSAHSSLFQIHVISCPLMFGINGENDECGQDFSGTHSGKIYRIPDPWGSDFGIS